MPRNTLFIYFWEIYSIFCGIEYFAAVLLSNKSYKFEFDAMASAFVKSTFYVLNNTFSTIFF